MTEWICECGIAWKEWGPMNDHRETTGHRVKAIRVEPEEPAKSEQLRMAQMYASYAPMDY